MSLATRCTACGTIFRVVQDQLRVSEGWVRCGRCAEVFDAREQLFDLERDAPPAWPPASAPSSAPASDPIGQAADRFTTQPAATRAPTAAVDVTRSSAPRQPHSLRTPHDATHDVTHGATRASADDSDATWELPVDEAPIAAPKPSARKAATTSSQAPSSHQRRQPPIETQRVDEDEADEPPELDFALSSSFVHEHRREPFFGPASGKQTAPSGETKSAAALPTSAPMPGAPPASGDPEVVLSPALTQASQGKQVPSFMQDGRQASRWQRPAWRWGLMAGSAMLTLSLLSQGLWQFRDALAAQHPALAPGLSTMCETLGCKLQPWKHLEGVSVESSSLTLAGSGPHYKLTVQLRNKGTAAVALPWLDLNLTDAQGGLIARRMLPPQDFQLKQDRLPAHGEQTLSLVFNASGLKVSGYTVEIFHP